MEEEAFQIGQIRVQIWSELVRSEVGFGTNYGPNYSNEKYVGKKNLAIYIYIYIYVEPYTGHPS